MSRRPRQVTEILNTVPLLARRLRSAARAHDDTVERVQTDLALALRCVDLVLALDEALSEEERQAASATSEMPVAVLDLGRLIAQGLLTGPMKGHLSRFGMDPLPYLLTRTGGGGYMLSVWAGARRSNLAIVTTQPRFGGDRFWFLCPAHDQGGDRRSLHLYLEPKSGEFSCRACSRVSSRWPASRLREQRTLDLAERLAG